MSEDGFEKATYFELDVPDRICYDYLEDIVIARKSSGWNISGDVYYDDGLWQEMVKTGFLGRVTERLSLHVSRNGHHYSRHEHMKWWLIQSARLQLAFSLIAAAGGISGIIAAVAAITCCIN